MVMMRSGPGDNSGQCDGFHTLDAKSCWKDRQECVSQQDVRREKRVSHHTRVVDKTDEACDIQGWGKWQLGNPAGRCQTEEAGALMIAQTLRMQHHGEHLTSGRPRTRHLRTTGARACYQTAADSLCLTNLKQPTLGQLLPSPSVSTIWQRAALQLRDTVVHSVASQAASHPPRSSHSTNLLTTSRILPPLCRPKRHWPLIICPSLVVRLPYHCHPSSITS